MTRFWLATFVIEAPADPSIAGPIVAAGTQDVAIEVLRENDDWAVLFSSVTGAQDPSSMALTCLIGFTNVAKACNVWLDRGFPLIDAAIEWTGQGALKIRAPFFSEKPVMHYDTQLLQLSGIDFGPATAVATEPRPAAGRALGASYRQHLLAPDGAQPDVFVTRAAVTWTPERSNVQALPAGKASDIQLDLGAPPARCPSLAPLGDHPRQATAAWLGDIRVPDKTSLTLGERLSRQRPDLGFGAPAFRFEDVEILGFRIDLARIDRPPEKVREILERLVAPLNFHLSQPGSGRPGEPRFLSIPDFRYRAATSTLVIELLRYGRMTARVPTPPLAPDDSQSQHELIVRLLVGRVDDDTAQAHDPAVYAPAVFVDNPWSKVLGRDGIGYDKRMAEFCIAPSGEPMRLLPDGRLPTTPGSSQSTEGRIEPLGAIRHINLVERTGGPRRGLPLLDLDYPSDGHTDPEALEPIDLDLTLGSSVLAGTRWRQSDFDDIEFRRSFASIAIADSARTLRGIQVAPVSERGGLAPAWITGRFMLDDDMRAALPSGTASLTLHAVRPDSTRPSTPAAPLAWNLLCEILGDGRSAKVAVTGGSWYRLLCSMDLRIDDGLDWGTF